MSRFVKIILYKYTRFNFFKYNKSEAVNYLNKAIELSPNYLGAHEKLAWISIFDGDLEKAIYHFSVSQAFSVPFLFY